MNVFTLRNQLIRDYATDIKSFINIQDRRIRDHVEQELRDGALWPDPLIQLNPNFEPGAWVDDLVDGGILHPLCKQIFRIKKDEKPPLGEGLRLHKHQSDAIEAAKSGDNYVLTTGTGSGKSRAYIIPIVDHVLRHGKGRGIQAIVVYPMNALANSQVNELEKFLGRPFSTPPVTFRRYTGQESDDEKQEIIANPPDIILTNYVMLELVMTRPHERKLVQAARGLKFLVLDELHTYRGRQGADVAMLVRRVRDMCGGPDLQVVGTSATLAGGGTLAEQQREVAEVATCLFGAQVKPERVIGETLRRATRLQDLSNPSFVQELAERIGDPDRRPPMDYDGFVRDPLSIWIEAIFGLEAEPESGRLRRAVPISITGDEGAARQLAGATGVSTDRRNACWSSGRILLGRHWHRHTRLRRPPPCSAFPRSGRAYGLFLRAVSTRAHSIRWPNKASANRASAASASATWSKAWSRGKCHSTEWLYPVLAQQLPSERTA